MKRSRLRYSTNLQKGVFAAEPGNGTVRDADGDVVGLQQLHRWSGSVLRGVQLNGRFMIRGCGTTQVQRGIMKKQVMVKVSIRLRSVSRLQSHPALAVGDVSGPPLEQLVTATEATSENHAWTAGSCFKRQRNPRYVRS